MLFNKKTRAVLAAFLLCCCSIRSSTAADRPFPPGVRYEYEFRSAVFVNGTSTDINPVGHRVTGRLSVANLWNATDGAEKLLRLHVKSPKLQTWSKKSKRDARRRFIDRRSKIDEFADQPFFVHWQNGRVVNLYASATKSLAEENFKKGIAALFQFKLTDERVVERSTLGECDVTYSKINDTTVSKRVAGCVTPKTLPEIKHPDKIFQGVLRSKREGLYTHDNDGTLVRVSFDENHEFSTVFVNETSASLSSEQHLQLKETGSHESTVEAGGLEEVIGRLEEKMKTKLEKHDLNAKHIVKNCKHYKSCGDKLDNAVNKYRDSLSDSELGKSKSAHGAVQVMEAIVNSDAETIKKVLTDDKNKDIKIQLYDLLGMDLNENSHKAAMETLVFNDPNNFDEAERYLWSASIKFNPKIEIIKSLMSLTDKRLATKTLEDTVYNTVAAMANHLVRYNNTESNVLFYDELLIKSLDRLNKCKRDDDECILTYIRSLANLKHPLSIDVLLDIAQNGNRKTSAYAMKIIKMLGPTLWNSRVLKYCNQIFFQLIKKQDSSTRTIALSILLKSDPDYDLLKHVVQWLMVPGEGYEVKKHALELLMEMANQNRNSAKLLQTVLARGGLNHYGTMAQRGLSSSFSRQLVNYNDIVGLMKTSQHIYSGVIKRGSVDIVVKYDNVQYDLCSFGMFTTGLGYFTSLYDDSGKTDTSDEANLPATAGMELSVFGVHIRPFVMFTSQGQLMGHVWAGTGSDRTPIIQGISQIMEHLEYVPLNNGLTAELSLRGMVSLDIAGQIEMSLWNKNAQTMIEQSAGVSMQGTLKLDTDVVTEEVNFSMKTEGLLYMHSDVEFAKKIVLCMQTMFMGTNVTTSVEKREKVHGQPYASRITTVWTRSISGRTLSLNRPANEFCNEIHSRQTE